MATFKGNVCSTPAYIPQADLYENIIMYLKKQHFLDTAIQPFLRILFQILEAVMNAAHTPRIFTLQLQENQLPQRE
jgi:hypothetical protein